MGPAGVWRREHIPATPLPQPGSHGSPRSLPVPRLPQTEVAELSPKQGQGKWLILGVPCQGWDIPVGPILSSSTPCTLSFIPCCSPHLLSSPLGFFLSKTAFCRLCRYCGAPTAAWGLLLS